MVDWHRFTPSDFEYDFERDELGAHRPPLRGAMALSAAPFCPSSLALRSKYIAVSRRM
jgi:hypothetical protein